MITMAPRLMKGLIGKPPEPEPVVPMPDPDSPEAQAARRKQMQQIVGRSGRQSTLLSGGSGALGG